ncbi:unnamed protein product [Effrenium voratum]|nr:unnamed protein product [Effrenium voratum]
MPSVFFAAKEVKYGEAPFPEARLGFNQRARSLNMIYSPSHAALELVCRVMGEEVQLDGKTCAVGGKVRATFADEAAAAKFAGLLRGEAVVTEIAEEVPAPCTPVRRPSKLLVDTTPPRRVRPKLVQLDEMETEMERKAKA